MPISATDLNKAYLAYFGRPADLTGKTYFATLEQADVIKAFDASAESKALYGDNVASKVNAIYQNLFNRDAEPAGLVYWTTLINQGRVTAAGAALAILNGAQGTDTTAVTNKLAASEAFVAALNTTPELVGYSGMEAAASARSWLKAVGADAASLTAAIAGVDAAVTAAVAVGGVPGATFTLTVGIDNFVGGAGNDMFIGGNGAADTTGPADQLDGGAGVDTFKFYGGTVTGQMPTLKNIEKLFLSASDGTVNAAGIAGVESVEVNNAAAAHTVTLGAAQKFVLSDINAAGVATTVTGSAAGGITLNNVVDKSVTPNVAQTLNVNTRDTALNLKATGAASNINLNNTVAANQGALNTIVVDGDAALRINANATYTNLTKVDASANTGGVNFVQGVDTNLTFTGGTGNDRVQVAAAAIVAQDKLDGGEGKDTLAISNGGLTANAVANVKNFEVLEVRGGITQDASVFAAQNTLTGLTVTNTGAAQTFSVTNLAATAKDGIIVTTGIAVDTTALTTTVKGFVSGGTSDSATVTVNANAASTAAAESVLNLTFDNVDVLNLVSSGRVATNANDITVTATDLEKLVVTGNIDTEVFAGVGTNGITEVDASGLVVANGTAAGLTFAQLGASTQSILLTGSNGLDNLTVVAAKGTVVSNGGNDNIIFTGTAAAVGDQAVVLSAKDFVAGGALNVTFAALSANNAIINFSSDIESKLIVGGANLGSTVANQAIGGAINGQNNVALVAGVLQFDVNGDGAFNAADDFSITLTGLTTVTYNAAGDFFVLA